ncbi:DNA polymerase III subunit beta [Candidatus Daviesbacteria bacterium]|nr:DNA polymerase III subunit beta [Candidatus Daviesbacteria bacterium]
MKISILQQDLLPALQAVARSTGGKNLPVLANILLQTGNGKIKLSATNLEIGVVKSVNAKVLEEGEITVPARVFLEVVSSLAEEELEVESQGEQIKVSAKKFNAKINGIGANEFPPIPLSSEKGVFILGDVLKTGLPEVTFAAANDEGRPVLTGILTQIKEGLLELVATDGFRLAHKTANLESSEEVKFSALIPRRTFEEVVRLISEELGKEGDKVELSTSENQNQVIFKIGQAQVSSRLIEGQFPAWEKIIPKSFQNRTVVDRMELLKAVKLASVFAKDASNIVKIETGKDTIKLRSETKEIGGQEAEVEAQVEGEEITIAFNNKFLTDALSAIPTSQISIEFSGNLSPALIKPVGQEGLDYVVMPIRLS